MNEGKGAVASVDELKHVHHISHAFFFVRFSAARHGLRMAQILTAPSYSC